MKRGERFHLAALFIYILELYLGQAPLNYERKYFYIHQAG